MNTFLRSLVTLALVLPLALAHARPGSTGSFKGGFSSQKASPTSVKPLGSRMGGFGAAKPQPDAARKSAMASDLDKKAAQDRALSSLDARRNAARPSVPPAAPVMSPAPAAPQRQPVIVQERRSGSGWGGAIMGFMLGSALSSHATAAPAPVVVKENTTGTITPAAVPADAAAVPAPVSSAAAAAPAQAEGWGMSALRLLLWSAIAATIVWMVAKYRRMKTASTRRYSLEGH